MIFLRESDYDPMLLVAPVVMGVTVVLLKLDNSDSWTHLVIMASPLLGQGFRTFLPAHFAG